MMKARIKHRAAGADGVFREGGIHDEHRLHAHEIAAVVDDVVVSDGQWDGLLAPGIVDILVSGKASKRRLPQPPEGSMATVLPGAGIATACHGAETGSVVKFAISQQSGIDGDPRAVKLKLQAAVKIESERTGTGSPVGSARRD